MTKAKKRQIAVQAATLVAVVGLCVFVRGVVLAWRPGGWMIAGLLIAAPGFLFAYDQFRSGVK